MSRLELNGEMVRLMTLPMGLKSKAMLDEEDIAEARDMTAMD